MLIAFRSKAATEILMMGEHASAVLGFSGKSADTATAPRGTFTVEQLPAAIAALERDVAEAPVPANAETGTADDDEHAAAPSAAPVSLRQRAFPLLDMLRQAQAKGVGVNWEPAT